MIKQEEAEDDVMQSLRNLKAEPDDDKALDALPWVEKGTFNSMMGFIILANAVAIGIEADDQKQNVLEKRTAISDRMQWFVIENIFLVIFLAELCARLFYAQMAFFRSAQNLCDLVLVLINIIDTWIFQPLDMGAGLRQFTIFRIVRILRLVRLIRILKVFSQLFLLVAGLSNAMRTLFWVAVMLFICLYTCGIFVTLTIGHEDDLYNPYFKRHSWDHEAYFGNIWKSMFTLFQVTTLDHWSEDVVRHIIQVQPAMVWFFLGFVLFSAYGLLNLVIGVIVESTLAMAKLNNQQNHAKKQAERKAALNHIRASFEQMDEDGSGTLTMMELKKSIEDPEIATRLKMIEFPIEEPEKIFVLMDVENKGELDIDQFVRGCMRLGGQAQSKDILEVLISVGLLGKHLASLEEKILAVQTKTVALDMKTETMVTQAHDMFSNERRSMRMKIDLD